MATYETNCWYCGKASMVQKGDYYQCSECGATWNEVPDLGTYQGIVRERGAQDGGTKYKPKRQRCMAKGGSPLKPLPKY